MIPEEKIREIARYILKSSKAEQMEVLIYSTDYALSRFANNTIHQNIASCDCNIYLRVVDKKRIATALGNKLKKGDLKALCTTALKIARARKPDRDFVSLPSPTEIKRIEAYDKKTAEVSPHHRAKIIKSIIKCARRDKAVAAGSLSTSATCVHIANSLGVDVLHRRTFADLVTSVSGDTGAGYAVSSAERIDELDYERCAQIACAKCTGSANPVDLEPGSYTVVLEPLAVVTLIEFLAYLGFGAREFQEKRSFMAGKIGKEITGDNLTIYDDGLSEEGFPDPFDAEGVAREKVTFIENGTARAVAYDSYTATKENKKSTGHATPAYYNAGPFPTNLFMEAGGSSLEEMIFSTEKGILVTRFHYTNIVEPMTTVITGMTRDGTFLIENGKITRPIRNLRFTQSILEAFKNIELISSPRVRISSEGATYVVPALKIKDFRFTGKTQ